PVQSPAAAVVEVGAVFAGGYVGVDTVPAPRRPARLSEETGSSSHRMSSSAASAMTRIACLALYPPLGQDHWAASIFGPNLLYRALTSPVQRSLETVSPS